MTVRELQRLVDTSLIAKHNGFQPQPVRQLVRARRLEIRPNDRLGLVVFLEKNVTSREILRRNRQRICFAEMTDINPRRSRVAAHRGRPGEHIPRVVPLRSQTQDSMGRALRGRQRVPPEVCLCKISKIITKSASLSSRWF